MIGRVDERRAGPRGGSGDEGRTEDGLGLEMAGQGRAALLVTRGRLTGRPAWAVVGFVEAPDDAILVAAGDPDADWARNLEAHPRCRIRVGDREWAAMAEPITGAAANAAVRDLILRYGTPAERLGRGPVFRLRRTGRPPAGGGLPSPS
jgi:deazaflavin-dependent oxidoreductase (nitroreductase family)